MQPTIQLPGDAVFVRATSGTQTDLIEDVAHLPGPAGPAVVDAIRARIETEVDLIVQWNRDAWRAARTDAAATMEHLEQQIADLNRGLAAVAHELEHCGPVRLLVMAILGVSVVTCLGAEYAWTLQAFPFLLDLAQDSPLGVILSALPVAAVTAIEWALAAMCVDRIRGFRSSLHAGRVTNRTVRIAGILGIGAAGLVLLALNIEMILQLDAVRAIAHWIETDAAQDADAFARAQSVIDFAVKVLGVVVALDTAVLLMALQEELGTATRVARLGVSRHRLERNRHASLAAQRDAKARHQHAAHQDDTGAERATTIGDEYRARALDRLQRRLETLKPKQLDTLEEIADWRLSAPPAWDHAGTTARHASRIH